MVHGDAKGIDKGGRSRMQAAHATQTLSAALNEQGTDHPARFAEPALLGWLGTSTVGTGVCRVAFFLS